jgi:hypothetical protein
LNEENTMMPVPSEAFVAVWKRQIDLGLQVAEAIVQGVQATREIQRDAAAETHASLEAARSALASTSPAELAAVQLRLSQENLGKVAHYWGALANNARDTQGRIMELLVRSSVATPLLAQTTQVTPPSAAALNEMVDAGYRQWLETLRNLYAMPAAAKSG